MEHAHDLGLSDHIQPVQHAFNFISLVSEIEAINPTRPQDLAGSRQAARLLVRLDEVQPVAESWRYIMKTETSGRTQSQQLMPSKLPAAIADWVRDYQGLSPKIVMLVQAEVTDEVLLQNVIAAALVVDGKVHLVTERELGLSDQVAGLTTLHVEAGHGALTAARLFAALTAETSEPVWVCVGEGESAFHGTYGHPAGFVDAHWHNTAQRLVFTSAEDESAVAQAEHLAAVVIAKRPEVEDGLRAALRAIRGTDGATIYRIPAHPPELHRQSAHQTRVHLLCGVPIDAREGNGAVGM